MSNLIWCLTLEDVDCDNGSGILVVINARDGIVILLSCNMYKGMRNS